MGPYLPPDKEPVGCAGEDLILPDKKRSRRPPWGRAASFYPFFTKAGGAPQIKFASFDNL